MLEITTKGLMDELVVMNTVNMAVVEVLEEDMVVDADVVNSSTRPVITMESGDTCTAFISLLMVEYTNEAEVEINMHPICKCR